MYRQSSIRRSQYLHNWRNQERLNELEKLLDSDSLADMDPAVAEDMKRIIRNRKEQTPA